MSNTTFGQDFDDFWRGYLFGLAFTASQDNDTGDPPDCWGNPGGDIRDVVDPDDVERVLSEAGELEELRGDCLAFLNSARDLINAEEGYSMESAGSDFHLTRNGHGVGFWDRDLESGEKLTELAKVYGSAELRFSVDDAGQPTDWYVCN